MMDCDKAILSPIIVDLSNGHAGHDGDSSIGGDSSARPPAVLLEVVAATAANQWRGVVTTAAELEATSRGH